MSYDNLREGAKSSGRALAVAFLQITFRPGVVFSERWHRDSLFQHVFQILQFRKITKGFFQKFIH